ncbi:MAG TPA: hypothetical protein VFA34_00130 [Actinomycetota bacterium]|jgi:hypothetical protein|nr:hypothetical protein [Actinomycetota bacterium]
MSSRETFDRYVAAWGTVDIAQIAPFYGFPSLFVSPAIHAVVRDREELIALIEPIVAGMKASDYARSDVADVQVRALGANLEEVVCEITRFNRAGDPILRANGAYFWRRDAEDWRLIATFAGDPVAGEL